MSISRPNPQPLAASVEFTDRELIVWLNNGLQIRASLDQFPRLKNASQRECARWEIIGRGVGIHWPLIDEDLSIHGLLTAPSRRRPRAVRKLR